MTRPAASRSGARDQASLIRVFAHTLVYNALPFFRVKNSYLRLTGARIGRHSYIHTPIRFTLTGNLQVGDHCTINFGCYLDTRRPIVIGNNVMIGHGSRIYTVGHDIDDPQFGARGGPVRIEDDVVIFPQVLIMPNVRIGRGAVAYPGSVITRDVGAFEVVGGNPARVLRRRAEQIGYRLDNKWWFTNA